MIKRLKNKKIVILTLLVILLVSVFCSVGATVFADEKKTIESIDYYSHEVLIVGEKVDFKATVTFSDGTQEERTIKYIDFPVNKMHDVFHDFTVRGYVEGCDEEINQTIIVMPANVVYMINFGSNLTDVDYSYPSEGVLGKELDPTGEASLTDPYNQAILRKFPNMLNKVGAKEYGQGTPSSAGDWGYVGSDYTTQKVTGSIENTGRNVFKHLIFLKRNSGKNITIKFSLPSEAQNYDVHFGFYSYWFARSINIDLNEKEIKSNYTVSPSETVWTAQNQNLSGENTIFLEACDTSDAYAQALSSFICVTEADTTKYETAKAPTCPDALDLIDTEMQVSDLTANTILQIYDYDTGYLLCEHKVGEDETSYSVSLDGLSLDGVSRIGVCCSNAGFMGKTTIVRRTDVENFIVDYTTDFVGSDLKVNLSAYAKSKIVALRVYKDSDLVIEKSVDSVSEWQDTIYLSVNGSYRFEAESSSGGVGVEEREITNIDNGETTLKLIFNKDTVSRSSADSVLLKMQTDTVSTIIEKGYTYNNDSVKTLDIKAEEVTLTSGGDYIVYFTNLLNKTGAYKVRFTKDYNSSLFSQISIDTSARFKEVNISSDNDYTITSVTVYGNIAGETEKMIVNGTETNFDFTIYKDAVYFAEITTSDGSHEIVVIDTLTANVVKKKTGCSSSVKCDSIICVLLVVAMCGFVVNCNKKIKSRRGKDE